MLRRAFLSILPGLLAVSSARAQPFPGRPITIVVPFVAGGPSDVIARLIGQSMTATLGQQIMVENVAGAGGTVGAARVAKAEPDGYTLLLAHAALPASASLYGSLPYDTRTGFETVGLVNYGPMALVGRKTFPANDARELLARLKAGGRSITVGHAGTGSNGFLCALLLETALGTKFTEAVYRGTGPAMDDVVAEQVDVLFDQSTTAVPRIEAGAVKGFAVTSSRRSEALIGLPTLQEAGVPGFEFVVWHGLYAPAGTPAWVVTDLNRALRGALADPVVRARFAAVGTDLFGEAERTPEAHRTRFNREIALWRDVVARTGVKAAN